jgi:hypothetical protein
MAMMVGMDLMAGGSGEGQGIFEMRENKGVSGTWFEILR